MPNPPRLLVITAAFGEGHNSAARNLALALTERGADARVCDPCLMASPLTTRVLSYLYRFATDYLPKVWEKIYYAFDRVDLNHSGTSMSRKPEQLLAKLISEYRPTAIVSTYPLYPYLLHRIFQKSGGKLPVFTVVTDSMEINAAWLRAPSDYWLVTDPSTRESMIRKGLAGDRIVDTGFPVNPEFSRLNPLTPDEACGAFHVLFFPTAKRHALTAFGTAVLAASPSVHLTLVLGKNVRLLHAAARALRSAHPGRVRILGWTRRVPRLLNQHHLVVGKAGGATVHEAIAARCPMLIHHLVPGQEEGNLRLLESIGCGSLTPTPADLTNQIKSILADDASCWRTMKNALIKHNRNAGAITAANLILHVIGEPAVTDPAHLSQITPRP